MQHRSKFHLTVDEIETKSENLSIQNNPSEMSEDFESTDKENLVDFFLSRLDEEASFEKIRKVAKIAILNGVEKNNNTKKTGFSLH